MPPSLLESPSDYPQVVWEYALGYQTMVFGDADRLPSGNVLGVAWPYESDDATGVTFDMEAFEVVRETGRRAWQLRVYGGKTADATLWDAGWVSYSIERIYEVHHAPSRYRAIAPSHHRLWCPSSSRNVQFWTPRVVFNWTPHAVFAGLGVSNWTPYFCSSPFFLQALP